MRETSLIKAVDSCSLNGDRDTGSTVEYMAGDSFF